MTGANGPCGAAACYTAAQAGDCDVGTLNRNRVVLGQLIGASNYDVGHIGLGVDGGGVAYLGVAGGDFKAGGCTGVDTPVGDLFAVDYVAHESATSSAPTTRSTASTVTAATTPRTPPSSPAAA